MSECDDFRKGKKMKIPDANHAHLEIYGRGHDRAPGKRENTGI